jgi:acetyl-CoA carboxylase biotin carboxyl carrier protein
MNQKDIHDLIKLINKTDISEFRMKNKEFSILIRSNDYIKNSGTTVVNTTPTIAAAVPNAPAPVVSLETDISKASEKSDDSKYVTFKSPIVGTFYRKPTPDKDVFVKVGDTVSNGSILCVIEAMKLFNEIECEISGKIVKILADDSTPVEYDQALFLIDPS